MSKKRHSTTIFITLSILCLIAIGLTSQKIGNFNLPGNVTSMALLPFQNLTFLVKQKFNDTLIYFSNINALKNENTQLQSRIDTLEAQNREFLEYKKTNTELKEALSIKNQMNDYESVAANVIASDSGNLFDVLTINKGSKDGIKEGDSVITGKGFIGKISNVYFFTSTVMSILDENSSIGGRITKSRDLVVVKGDITLKNDYLSRVEYIPQDVDVAIGDTVETAGLSHVLPKGLIIGKITQVRARPNELNKYALLEPAVDFKRIEYVIVLKSKITTN